MYTTAAVLRGLGKPLTVENLTVPLPLGVGQVLVSVKYAGICGAQLGEIAGAKGLDPYLPHLLGHEAGAIVKEIGPGVTRIKPGDHVVAHWRKAPGIDAVTPVYTCQDGSTVGAGPVAVWATNAVVAENRLTPIPGYVPLDVAAAFGCSVTTALGLVDNEACVRLGETVVVAGCGGVGLMAVVGARLAGAAEIIALDVLDYKLELALAMGATHTINTAKKDIEQCPVADVFVDCTGVPDVISAGWGLVKPQGGKLVLVGQVPLGKPLTVYNMHNNYCGKTVLDSQGGLTQPDVDIPRYLRLWQDGRIPFISFLTHTYQLQQVNEALVAVRTGRTGKCLLTM